MLMHIQAKTELSLAMNEFILFSKKKKIYICFEIYSLLPFITLAYPIIMDNQKKILIGSAVSWENGIMTCSSVDDVTLYIR